jgi:hypothetical protein
LFYVVQRGHLLEEQLDPTFKYGKGSGKIWHNHEDVTNTRNYESGFDKMI